MKTICIFDIRIPAFMSRIRAVILAGTTVAVLATAPPTAQAGVIFQFVPDNPAITDVSGFFEISDTAFANRMADTTVVGEVIDFFFEFIEDGRFPFSGSFSLADLGVGLSDSSFKLTVDPTGTFLSAVASIDSSGAGPIPNLFLVNGVGDSFGWDPTVEEAVRILLVDLGFTTIDTLGKFKRPNVPEPSSLLLFGVGLAGLVFVRRRALSHKPRS